MLIVSLRWLGVVMLLLVFARQAVCQEWDKLRPHLPTLFMMGALGFATFNALFYLAAHTTTALNIGIIQGVVPIFLLVGAWLLYRVPVSVLQGLGAIITILGVCIVASAGELEKLASLSINPGRLPATGSRVCFIPVMRWYSGSLPVYRR